jgi:hypothetical protein
MSAPEHVQGSSGRSPALGKFAHGRLLIATQRINRRQG